MVKKTEILTYIFIHCDNVYRYQQNVKFCSGLKQTDLYLYIKDVARWGVNIFLRDLKISEKTFSTDFIVFLNELPYYFYTEKNIFSDGSYDFYIDTINNKMNSKEITNKFTYESTIIFANDSSVTDTTIPETITTVKIIDDGFSKFDESCINMLDTVAFTVEYVYLLYNVTKQVCNLPMTCKKLYVYDNCNKSLLKIPYGCEVITIQRSDKAIQLFNSL